MCRYCKKLQELRKEEQILYSKVLKRYKSIILKDEKVFNRCLDLLDELYYDFRIPEYFIKEFCDVFSTIEDILKGGVYDEKNESSS